MRKLTIFLLLVFISITAIAAVMRGPDGRWYGNVCLTDLGWQVVNWQLVGSTCYAPMWNRYGFIANA